MHAANVPNVNRAEPRNRLFSWAPERSGRWARTPECTECTRMYPKVPECTLFDGPHVPKGADIEPGCTLLWSGCTPNMSVGKDQVADSALEPRASSHVESKVYELLLGTHHESAEIFSSIG